MIWRHLFTAAIGGLENIDFIDDERILVLSGQGLGVFNCRTGELLYRSEVEWWPSFDESSNVLQTVSDYYSLPLKIYGLHSQLKMPTNATDGWQLVTSEPAPDDPPFEKYAVIRMYLEDSSGNRTLVAKDGPCELRALGFSETGQVAVVATSCEIVVWGRND